MGYASYYEDIILRLNKFEKIIDTHNKANDKQININDYFELRREVLKLVTKLKPYLEQDIDIVDYNRLKESNERLQKEIESLKQRNAQLNKEILKSNNKKENLLQQLNQLSKSIRAIQQKSDSLVQEKEILRKDLNICMQTLGECKLSENTVSDLFLDSNRIFHQLKSVVSSNSWYKDKEKQKQIEFLIAKGLS